MFFHNSPPFMDKKALGSFCDLYVVKPEAKAGHSEAGRSF